MLCRASPILFLILLLTGCASTKTRQPTERSFVFERDTFAFSNELLWEYEIDEETGERTTRSHEPEPEFHHFCFPMTRAARQFYDFAEFRPDLESPDEEATLELINNVLDRGPRSDPSKSEKIVFNGYSGLRDLSEVHEAQLKDALGGNWQSWFQRGNWRVVFPFSRGGQQTRAESFRTLIENGQAPIVHLVRFPALTINHALLLFGVEETDDKIRFDAYDPNTVDEPLTLTFVKADQTFYLPATPYWQGGRVDVYEVFKNGFY